MDEDEFEGESMASAIAGEVIDNLPATEISLVTDPSSETAFELSLPFLKLRLTWKA